MRAFFISETFLLPDSYYLYNEETGMGRGRKGDFMDPFLKPLIISAAPFMERMERRAALGKRRKNAAEREGPKDLEKTTDVRRLPEKGKKSSGGRRKPSGISCFWIWRKKRGTGVRMSGNFRNILRLRERK